mgnify:FL=1
MTSEQDQPLGINIEVEDLKELARINPVAWEQLLHIVDNREKDARIAELEDHLAYAHDSILIEDRVVTKAELDRIEAKNGSTEVA